MAHVDAVLLGCHVRYEDGEAVERRQLPVLRDPLDEALQNRATYRTARN